MDCEPPDFHTRIATFFLILIPILFVWGAIDICRYFFFNGKPTVNEIVAIVGGVAAFWIVGNFVDHARWNQKRLDDVERRLSALEKRIKENY